MQLAVSRDSKQFQRVGATLHGVRVEISRRAAVQEKTDRRLVLGVGWRLVVRGGGGSVWSWDLSHPKFCDSYFRNSKFCDSGIRNSANQN